MQAPDILFPNLNITINHLPRVAFYLFGIEIYWYAIFVMAGYMAALVTLRAIARRTGQDPELYFDYIFVTIIFGLIGARIYYVIFTFDNFRGNLLSIFAFRDGGLGIYGGLILASLYTIRFVRKRNIKYGVLSDTAGPAIAIGHAFGRVGNLFNREAFGGYTDSLLAIRFRVDQVYYMPPELSPFIEEYGVRYIQVHPFFLYEILWNLALFTFLIIFRKYKKFDGQIFMFYIIGYTTGRFWLEGLRADRLMLFGTGLAVSQVLSGLLAVGATALMLYVLIRNKKRAEQETS